jgi:protein SCO1/2
MNHTIQKHSRLSALACLIIFASLAGMLVVTGCSRASERGTALKPSCCTRELTATAPVSDQSLYQLDSSWTNDQGAALPLASLRGRPQIVTMFFARCEFACPILVHDMKRIAAALPESLQTNVGFVLVSFDSERDTPAALAGYRKIHQLPPNWTLLRGTPDDVLELAALLGVKFKKDLRGQFAHSNLITVLDSNGEIASQQAGLNQRVDDLVSTVKRLSK